MRGLVALSRAHNLLVMDSWVDILEHAQGRARQKARGLRNCVCTSDDCIYLDRK